MALFHSLGIIINFFYLIIIFGTIMLTGGAMKVIPFIMRLTIGIIVENFITIILSMRPLLIQ